MRLKAIKLSGFKSFVDPTNIPFPTNLSAIVGPNGCGKSNTIDAVRWVLGESSAKNLRGESMTDVIFNGSNHRKPVGKCSVELVFDNSETTLIGEYAKYAEISIRRQVTREGKSTYYLNGTKCRRKDITDIFLGTGLGPRSYAIIEQGMISRLIESKPEELRVYIEEAAGISKYKERRRDTENRMKRTLENLERLTDIREELERQLAHLHRQAQAAEKYTNFKKEERVLKAQLGALRWSIMDEQVKQQELGSAQLEANYEEQIAGQRQSDAQIEEFRLSNSEVTDQFNEVQTKFFQLGNDIARFEQTMSHKQERASQLALELSEAERHWAEANRELEEDQLKLEELEESIEILLPEVDEQQEQQAIAQETLNEAQETLTQWQEKWEQFNQGAAGPKQQAEVAQSKIVHLDRVVEQLGRRLESLNSEKQQLTGGENDSHLEQLLEETETFEMQVEDKQLALEGLSESLTNTKELVDQKRRLLDEKRREEQQQKGRQATLEALQQAAKGEQSEAVGRWLESQQMQHHARLAEKINVNGGWDKAVELVLGRYLQAVCVDSSEGLPDSLMRLNEGSVIFTEKTHSQHEPQTLASVVQCEFALGADLNQVLLAENSQQALTLRQSLTEHQSVITKDGLWLSKHWLRVSKDSDNEAGVLTRAQELESLEFELDELDAQIEELEVDLETALLRQQNQEQERDQIQREYAEVSSAFGNLKAELSGKQVEIDQLRQRRDRINSDIEEVSIQLEEERENLSQTRLTLQEALDSMEDDVGEREELMEQKLLVQVAVDEQRDALNALSAKNHDLALQKQRLESELAALKQTQSRLLAQKERMTERKEQVRMSMEESSDPMDELRLELEEKLEQRVALDEQLKLARSEMEAIDSQMRELESQRAGFERKAMDIRSKLEQSRMEAQTTITRRATLEEQLVEQQFDLQTLIANMPDDADEDEWQTNLESLAGKIQRLGAINLAAIDEYKIQSERKTYLDAQNADLEKAIETLENAIRKIDKETRTRFKETFDKVNNGLQELFPKVFGGGHAYLELTGEDLLDTGVAIMARPPGKKNSTIHLLSGGEKALTAIALVFSIFKLNPAPFCMLDEVDAPLDDANVGRYARLVEAMSDHVQFIYITHNKIAMEMAHQLMGVTMNEPGVSRLVSVNVEEAAELAAM